MCFDEANVDMINERYESLYLHTLVKYVVECIENKGI